MRRIALIRFVVILECLVLGLGASVADAQEKIKVLSDGPLEPGLVAVAEVFRRATGYQVEFVFATSPVVHRKVVDGEVADVLIIQPSFIDGLLKMGKVISGQYPVIGRVGVGLATRAEAPVRDISTTETFKQVLLGCDALFYNNVASGDHFVKVLERLGIAEAVRAKSVRASPAEVFERTINNKGNNIGVGAIPLIIADKRLRLLGPLPAELQSYILYSAVLLNSMKSPKRAQIFIDFLTTPEAKRVMRASGVE